MHEDMELKEIRVFIFKYGFLWIGWLLIHQKERPIPYYENDPIINLEPEMNVRYVTFGLSKKCVGQRVYNRAKKICKEYENG